ncbi:unnamed protein product, partial [Porites lobata]
ESQINLLNTKLSEEQEKIIALENYSRRENLRFMNIPEQEHENCTDTVYDIVENGLNINTQNIYFHAVHRVGKPRSPEDSHHHPRPIIARFLCREDRDRVLESKGRLRHSTDYPNAYISKDYAKAIQLERKKLIKAMFIARKKGMSAKVVDTNLVINVNVYHVGNIPDELKPAAESTRSRFIWRRSKPEIHCRLDFFLTSNSLSSAITTAVFLLRYKTDHSLITLHLANNTNPRGPGFCKLNTSFLSDSEYINLIKTTITEVANECRNNTEVDAVLLWDTMKMQIRSKSIQYA